MLTLLLVAGTAWSLTLPTHSGETVGFRRRDVLSTLVVGGLSSSLAPALCAAEDDMRTSSTMNSFEEVTGQARSANLGAGSVSGKSRPETNVVLVEEPTSSDDGISAEVVLSSYVIAKVTFKAPGLPLIKGMYYDVEARNKLGDSAYIQVVPNATKGAPASKLVDAVLSSGGRYGAFGPPTDIDIKPEAKGTTTGPRIIDVSFSASAPNGSLQPRRATIAAISAPGSDDVLLLVSSASEKRWNAGGSTVAANIAQSFRIDSTRSTKLLSVQASDFRFEERGGIRGFSDFYQSAARNIVATIEEYERSGTPAAPGAPPPGT